MSCRCVRGRMLSADIGARMTAGSEVGAVMRSASSITARMTHACEVGRGDFLQVTPEVMWLTEANDFTGVFEVFSNVDWVVVGDIATDDSIVYLYNADDISNATMVSNIKNE